MPLFSFSPISSGCYALFIFSPDERSYGITILRRYAEFLRHMAFTIDIDFAFATESLQLLLRLYFLRAFLSLRFVADITPR